MRGIRVGVMGIRWEYGESGWECGEQIEIEKTK